MTNPNQAAGEREAFEMWFSGGDLKCRSIERSGESYKLMQAAIAWKVWQARAALSQPPAE